MPRQRQLILTIAAAVVAVAVGVVLSYVIHWFPVQASTQAKNTDRLYHVLVDASIPIFVLVVTVVLYCAWQFRVRPGEELKDGPPIHGNTRLEVVWTTIPAVILLALVSYSFVVLHDNEKKPVDVPVPAVGHRRQAGRIGPAVPAAGRVGQIRAALQGRHPRLLDPRVSPAGGRRTGHHDQLARDAEARGDLPDRLQPAVRPGPLADALQGARARAGAVSRMAEGACRADRPRRRQHRRRRHRRGVERDIIGCGIMWVMSMYREPSRDDGGAA
jgi:hypothetical protein